MAGVTMALGLHDDRSAVDPRLPAPPTMEPARRTAWRPGFFPLNLGLFRDGLLHIPRSASRTAPLPLLVMLHGGGGEARSAVTLLRPHAERRGFVVLAPESRERRWIYEPPGGAQPDVDFIASALRRVYGSVAVDRSRVAIAGFSNGAAFGLGLTLANGDWVRAGLAFAAGGVPRVVRRGRPRLAVSHGRIDPGMAIERTNVDVVRRLSGEGYVVEFQPFNGGHEMPPGAISRALEVWLA